ncbi:RNA polymerase sigma-70 factor [Chitinophaga rhizophila]|uniref:RNA polymerase sigma-70 factor n=1 Tax=Chitinophaga rhizophila TaxID=2866212 RepID=A0ABS7GC81_9BACT|nr:RNA polymerase sigma-70 factor [Chitinophaga rhizophila]MBW8685278.1 RNA polymerase sigma-70 factor [Chitinophaga rhizophila]
MQKLYTLNKLINPSGEKDVYKQCFQDNFERLHRYAFTLLQDNEEARDVVQQAFVKLWQKREEVSLEVAGRAYLYTTVQRDCLNIFRNKKVKRSYANAVLATHKEDYVEERAENREINNRIHAAIDALPPRCREVFCKSRFEEKKYAEIAEELNISVKTVEVQMGKALKIMREQLADLITITVIIIAYFK